MADHGTGALGVLALLTLTGGGGPSTRVWSTEACSDSMLSQPHPWAACAFHPLLALAERSGWVLSRENCGETVGPEAFEVPPVLYFDRAESNTARSYTLLFLRSLARDDPRPFLQWLVVNVPESSLANGMTYMDGDTVMDYLSPERRFTDGDDYDDDDDDDDGQPTRYGFYLYEQVHGPIYPPIPNSRMDFDPDGWFRAIYPAATICGPVASIGFAV